MFNASFLIVVVDGLKSYCNTPYRGTVRFELTLSTEFAYYCEAVDKRKQPKTTNIVNEYQRSLKEQNE